MGRLINRDKLKRAKSERAAKKKRLLAEARSTIIRMPFIDFSLDTIGKQAGVDRGVASMLFRTREELFLLLLRDELDEWLTAVEKDLDARSSSLSAQGAVRLVAASLGERPDLTRMLSLLPVVLDQNLEAIEVFRFQKWRKDRTQEVGDKLDKLAPALEEGSGFRLLYLGQLLAGGLDLAANPRGSGSYEREDPEFARFWVDLADELEQLLVAALSS
jgi:AcrR family transcriptional regulator